MPRFSAPLLAGVSLLAIAFSAHATTVPTIVISATRSPLALTEVASSMTVITSEEIEQLNKPTVIDLLRLVPGLHVANNGGVGQTSKIFMRGTNSNHVLVLMDGIVINDTSEPGGAFDFSNLSLDNVERIEILRGVQSPIYGSQAIGGVINIISKKGQGAPRQTAFAEYGSHNTSRIGGGSSGEIGNISYSLNASNSHTNGISSFSTRRGGHEKDGSDTYTLAGNVAAKVSDTFTARLNLRYVRNNTEFDSPGSSLTPPRPSDDPLPENDSRQFNGRVAGEFTHLDGKWTHELGIGHLNLNRSQITEFYDPTIGAFGDFLFGRQQYFGWRDSIDWVHHVSVIPDHAFTFGIEARTEYFKTNSLPHLSVPTRNVDNHAIFINDQYTITPELFVNAGIRADQHQSFGRQTTWKIAPGYKIPLTGTRLKVTYGTGFNAPSLFYLYDPGAGNPNAKPERSRGIDVGFEQPLFNDRITVGATAFRNDISDLLSFASSPPYRTINIGKARSQGVESSLEVRPIPGFTLTATHTFTQADDRRADKQLTRRPKHQANMAAIYQYNVNGDVGMNVRYVGKASDIDYQLPFGRQYTRPFTVVDLTANYKVHPNATLYGRLENLFDRRYEEVYGYAQPGRGFYAGVKTGF